MRTPYSIKLYKDFPENSILGDKIYLVPITLSDTALIVKWRNNESVRSFFLFQDKITSDDHERWLREVVATGQAVQWIMHISETDIPIGSVYLRDIDIANRKCQFGIMIGESSARGKGYGSEACRLATEYAFNELSLYKIYLKVVSTNTRALKVYASAGYEVEGKFVADRWINGKPVDVIYMAKFAERMTYGNC